MNDDRQDGCAGIRSHAAILPAPSSGYLDYVYFSAITNTTVGFGDFVPSGPVRFLAGMGALTGLVLITWSASFTFLEMQRYWDGRQAGGRRNSLHKAPRSAQRRHLSPAEDNCCPFTWHVNIPKCETRPCRGALPSGTWSP